MRIISGKYKGRQLNASKDRSIRPTTNKIKEYIFNLLDDAVLDANVLDLFSGSGGLGIEALSRGAARATFVDVAQSSLKVLRRNLAHIKVTEQCRVVRRDAVDFLRVNKAPFDLIFVDPPFPWGAFEKLLPRAFTEKNLAEDGILVMENERSHEIDWESENFQILRQKQFDRSIISFLTRKGAL